MKHITTTDMTLLLCLMLVLSSLSSLWGSQDEKPIIEIRVYKITEGKMKEWERFFHDKLDEPQERAGMKILSATRTVGNENLFVWSRQFSSKANMPKERAAFYQSDLWKNVLRVELKERGLVEKVEIVYTVTPSR